MKIYRCGGAILQADNRFVPCDDCIFLDDDVNPYELHAQNQFHAPLSETNYTFTFESCVVVSESAARAIVAAIDDNRPHRAAHLIKELPWFAEILGGVRATRHLKPENYIALSERPWALMKSL